VRQLFIIVLLALVPARAFAQTVNDEFVGPLASWQSVKSTVGSCTAAVGDGVADDTAALQCYLNAVANDTISTDILYFPAGTYKINSGLTFNATTPLSMIGADPATTTIKWGGGAAAMLTFPSGIYFGEFARITYDGSGAATNIFACTRSSGNAGNGTIWHDNVFENAQYGFWTNAVTMGSEYTWLRNKFLNLSVGGAYNGNNFNGIDLWFWYNTFDHNAIALDMPVAEFKAFYNVFTNSSTEDITHASYPASTLILGNVSSGSNQFFNGGGTGGTNVNPETFRLNRIFNTTQAAAITDGWESGLTAIDNSIVSKAGNTTAPITLRNTNAGQAAFLIGNKFTVASGITLAGSGPRLVENDTFNVNPASISASCPLSANTNLATCFPAPPNNGRSITEYAAGTAESTIQTAIHTKCNGTTGSNRSVLHLQAGSYTFTTPLTFPSNCDIQLLGDGSVIGRTTHIASSAAGEVILLHSPSKVLIANMDLNTSVGAKGIYIGTEDVAGSRVQIRSVYADYNVKGADVLENGLTNTAVNVYDSTPFQFTGAGGASEPSFKVVGNGSAGAAARMGVWGANDESQNSQQAPELEVSNQGNLVVEGWYSEAQATNSKQPLFSVTDSGNLTVDGVLLQVAGTSEFCVFNATGFTGFVNAFSVETTNVGSTGNGQWCDSNPANMTMLMSGNVSVSANAAAGLNYGSPASVQLFGGWYRPSGGAQSIANAGASLSLAQLNTQLTQLRATVPSLNTDTGAGITDVQIDHVTLDNETNGIDVEYEAGPNPPPTQLGGRYHNTVGFW
jgi:hypothetical protein